MTKQLKIEVFDREKPFIVIAANKSPLLGPFILSTRGKFNIILLTDNEKYTLMQNENFHVIGLSSSYFLTKFNEKIDYSVIFLEDNATKNTFKYIFDKSKKDDAKVAVVISVNDFYNYEATLVDLILLKSK